MGGFDGKNIVITGGSTGIGLATAELLIAGGARVMISGRSEAALEAAAARLGPALIPVRADVTVLDDLDALAERARSELGAVDALFANAGITRTAPFTAFAEQDFDEVFATDAKGAYFTAQKLAPMIVDGGAIVFTTSVAGVKGNPGMSAYAAAKAAVRSMTRSLARELLGRRIRVNAISPGPIETGVIDRFLPAAAAEQVRGQMTAANPMGRFGTPDEVARAFAFLAFEATYTTGAELPVDGGVSQL